MRILIFFVITLLGQTGFSQSGSTSTSAGRLSGATSVNASDGIYEKFVLVRWEETTTSNGYRLFRANSPSGASLQEITKSAQKSTWFCDYSAEKEKDYYYAVMASQEGETGTLSKFDKGFLKKEVKMANDESVSAVSADRVGEGRSTGVLVADISTDTTTYQPATTVHLRIGINNIFEEPSPETHLRIYLSNDIAWDFDDKLLASKIFSGFPASAATSLKETFSLPSELLPGNYHLLVITAAEGKILQAKTGFTTIQISEK
jgi:hypothetical protein